MPFEDETFYYNDERLYGSMGEVCTDLHVQLYACRLMDICVPLFLDLHGIANVHVRLIIHRLYTFITMYTFQSSDGGRHSYFLS